MIDTHCHLHSPFFKLDADVAIAEARKAGIQRFVCVGVDAEDSEAAIQFVANRKGCYASIGIHPHEASNSNDRFTMLQMLIGRRKVIAIGEIGLDYWYENAPRDDQKVLLRKQIELALSSDMPIIFHVRGTRADPHDAFVDFFEILDCYPAVRGVVHSFTAGQKSLTGVLSRSLMVGVNGIATFTNDKDMLEAYRLIPSDKMVLETDAPFLTPVPKRGMVNTPKYMGYTAEFLANLRGESVDEIRKQTTINAETLFSGKF